MIIKSWPKLIVSILVAQSAGAIGSLFTISAIPTWYIHLNKPIFSPPNWLFGPVWTILYTLIGISLYRLLTNKNRSLLKLFIFHLILNAIWSPIFFGLKNLGLAFLIILLMDLSLIIIINKFIKIDKLAGYLLIPYLLWISFASILNFSIWKLNPNQDKIDVFAENLTFEKTKADYIFVQDKYRENLINFNLKKDSYNLNKTLALKEEARISLLNLLISRNDYKKSYLTLIRTKTSESAGLSNNEKGAVFSKIDPEVIWCENRKTNFSNTDSLEDLLNKSTEDDTRYEITTLPIVYYTLGYISLGEVADLKNKNLEIYKSLKTESENLVKLGRADSNLFSRWFKDIDQELNNILNIENLTKLEINKIFSSENYSIKKSYENVIEVLTPAQANLLQLNKFINELETTISEKR